MKSFNTRWCGGAGLIYIACAYVCSQILKQDFLFLTHHSTPYFFKMGSLTEHRAALAILLFLPMFHSSGTTGGMCYFLAFYIYSGDYYSGPHVYTVSAFTY